MAGGQRRARMRAGGKRRSQASAEQHAKHEAAEEKMIDVVLGDPRAAVELGESAEPTGAGEGRAPKVDGGDVQLVRAKAHRIQQPVLVSAPTEQPLAHLRRLP